MYKKLANFIKNEHGAVTVDWVVLTALAVTLMSAGYGYMRSGATGLSTSISTYMTSWTF